MSNLRDERVRQNAAIREDGDNLDATGRPLMPTARAVITTATGGWAAASRGLRDWETTAVGGVEVTATPCRHGPPGLRFVIGFHLRRDGSTLWISGDTVLSGDVRAAAERRAPDVLLLHGGCVRLPVTVRCTTRSARVRWIPIGEPAEI